MDEESGECTERAEVTGEMEIVGEKQGVDSRDEVKHKENTDQLFVKTTMKVDEKE